MSKQAEVSFLVKLFGGFAVVFLGFLLIVNLPAPGKIVPKNTVSVVRTVPQAKPVRQESRAPTSGKTYTSSHGTSSDRLGGSANPFTQTEGFNEEDALIYSILRQQGQSHEEAARGVISSAW